MTTLASDNFNRADSGNLGANWTDIVANFSISTNEAKPSSASAPSAKYTGVALPTTDQWAECTMGSVVETTTDEGGGPLICIVSAGTTYLLLQGNLVQTRIYTNTAGTFAQQGIDGPAVGVGDVLYLERQGTTIVALKNGISICGTPLTLSIADGIAGMRLTRVAVVPAISLFRAGDFTGGLSGQLVETPLKKRSWRPRPFGPGNAR